MGAERGILAGTRLRQIGPREAPVPSQVAVHPSEPMGLRACLKMGVRPSAGAAAADAGRTPVCWNAAAPEDGRTPGILRHALRFFGLSARFTRLVFAISNLHG